MDNNVFVEEFVSVVPAKRVPITNYFKLKNAVKAVDKLYKEYVTSNKVSHDWLRRMIDEYGEWLCAHLPVDSESYAGRSFNSTVLKEYYFDYLMTASTDAEEDIFSSEIYNSKDTYHEEALAFNLANDFTINGSEMIISFFTTTDFNDIMYIPKRNKVKQDDEGNNVFDANNLSVYSYLSMAFLACLISERATMAIAFIENGEEQVNIINFVDGAMCSFDAEVAAKIVEMIINDDAQDVEDALAEYEPSTTFEFDVSGMSMISSLAIEMVLDEIVTYHAACNSKPKLVCGSFSPYMIIESDDDEDIIDYDFYKVEDTGKSLPDIFDAIFNDVGSRDISAASKQINAIAYTRSLENIFSKGTLEDYMEDIHDFCMFMELDDGSRYFDSRYLSNFEDYAIQRADIKENDMFIDMYNNLEDNKRSQIDKMLNKLASRSDTTRQSVSFDLDMAEKSTEDMRMRAYVNIMPSNMPKDKQEDYSNGFRAVCTRSMLNNYAMIISFLNKDNKVDVAGIKWENGKWRGLGEQKTFELLTTTNIGSTMGIMFTDDINYIEL